MSDEMPTTMDGITEWQAARERAIETRKTGYEVLDPLVDGVWTPIAGVCNAFDAVRLFLQSKQYDPATFGRPRIFRVRFPNPEGWSYSSVRVMIPPPRFVVQCGPSDLRGPWKEGPKAACVSCAAPAVLGTDRCVKHSQAGKDGQN